MSVFFNEKEVIYILTLNHVFISAIHGRLILIAFRPPLQYSMLKLQPKRVLVFGAPPGSYAPVTGILMMTRADMTPAAAATAVYHSSRS